jgi:hypothetical protein
MDCEHIFWNYGIIKGIIFFSGKGVIMKAFLVISQKLLRHLFNPLAHGLGYVFYGI